MPVEKSVFVFLDLCWLGLKKRCFKLIGEFMIGLCQVEYSDSKDEFMQGTNLYLAPAEGWCSSSSHEGGVLNPWP